MQSNESSQQASGQTIWNITYYFSNIAYQREKNYTTYYL